MSDLVTCKKCGWVYFEESLESILKWEEDWKKLAKTMSKEDLSMFGITNVKKLPKIEDNFLKCQCGNSHKNFRKSKSNDCPDGCTISGILSRKYDFKRSKK